jgi:hypothetical protein
MFAGRPPGTTGIARFCYGIPREIASALTA